MMLTITTNNFENDVLRQRLAAEGTTAVAQADQRVDGQIKGAVHPYPSFTSS